MIASRILLLSFLSMACIGTFLYFTLIPQGPHLFRSTSSSNSGTAASSSVNAKSQITKASESSFSEAKKLDPEVLLSAPRRSSATPNAIGDLAVYTVSTYSFESHQKASEIRVLDIATGQSRLITNEEKSGSPNWLEGNELVWLRPGDNATSIIIGNADKAGKSYEAATVPAPISDIKVKPLDIGRIAVAIVAKARPDGSLLKPQEQETPRSSARLYDSLFVRHWDTYVTPDKNAIWHGILGKENHGKYALGGLTNILKGSKLESPIPTFGGLDNFDLAATGICFVARDPELNPAFNTKSDFYYVSVKDGPDGLEYSSPIKAVVEGFEGAATSPALSADGASAVFLQRKENGYESDKNHVLMLDVANPAEVVELLNDSWDRSPGSVGFCNDPQVILLTAEDGGRTKLFKLDLPENPGAARSLPGALTQSGNIADYHALGDQKSKLLLSGSSFIDNSFYSVLDFNNGNTESELVSSSSNNGSFFGLSQEQISEFLYEGADAEIHAWVVRPSNFDPEKRYPLAYLIHGGPQGSWAESWSTRWNPAVFAEQGYVVVLPDPTGSTGYGQGLTDGIKEQWGGKPYQDLVRGFEHIRANVGYIDTKRAVALGASYGGYMMAWMQGQGLGNEFEALVCHDGSFNLPAQLASDEQYFPNHDLGGPPTSEPHAWDPWSPHLYISNWTTPMLVIHNELDYRLPISEGLAMFNVLQERKIKSRFLSFPDENHWVLQEENSLVWHTVVLNWINSFVGLPPYKDEDDLSFTMQD